MALNDHFKALRVDEEIAKEEEEPRERLDLALKEGQTIKVCDLVKSPIHHFSKFCKNSGINNFGKIAPANVGLRIMIHIQMKA